MENNLNNPTPTIPNPVVSNASQPPTDNSPINVVTNTNQSKPTNKPQIIIWSIVGIIFLLIFSTLTAGLALAYEKFDIGNPELQTKISRYVQSIPFAPKTPKYVIDSVMLAFQKVHSYGISTNTKLKSSTPNPISGTDTIELDSEGFIDYSNLDNLKSIGSLKLFNLVELDYREKDHIFYFKLGGEWKTLIAKFGMNTDISSLLNRWIRYEIPPAANSKTGKDSDNENSSTTEKQLQKLSMILTDKSVINSLTMQKVSLDNKSKYKLDFHPTPSILEELYKKYYLDNNQSIDNQYSITNFIKDFRLVIWIDENSYQISNYNLSLNLQTPDYSSQIAAIQQQNTSTNSQGTKSELEINSTGQIFDYNKNREIELPKISISMEEFTKQIMSIMSSKSQF